MTRRCRSTHGENSGAKSRREALSSTGRGQRLLLYAIRENLPILGSQQRLGGQAKVLVRWSTRDGSCEWYITEGSARRTPDGEAVDYLLYGLVVGQNRRFDYFWLSDVMMYRDSPGMRVERDPCWQPKRLDEIAPEMFRSQDKEQED
ncbi:MAG: hypothetical protein RBS72_21540 [Sedimentisphaerales bacterium]|nr:hypothetical protein [Sedimentisphaerales bacterium]HOH65613.1 hypothetical protein [Sedimentisphaerales bacterium]HQA90997.1 hypothetical protein [Sedimentisphaerales bacterium]HQN36021.1 hypothetical protein [Sedimentisphaerales bacterium]